MQNLFLYSEAHQIQIVLLNQFSMQHLFVRQSSTQM